MAGRRHAVARRSIPTSVPARTASGVVRATTAACGTKTGATLEFSIAPAYYQTRWFQASRSRGVFALLWVGIGSASVKSRGSSTATLDERVNERTRIARELHDTLLQSFHGLLLQFQTASYLLTERPAEAKEQLDGAIEHAAKAITEGRDAVQGLRASTVERNDLARGDQDPWRRTRDPRERRPAAHIQCCSRGPDARSAPDRS